jgi:hypothetical protein
MRPSSCPRPFPFRPLALGLVASALTLAPSRDAAAQGLPADLVDAKTIKLDGLPKEFNGLVALAQPVKGTAKKPDLEAKATLAYDDTDLYLAVDVTDDVLKGGGTGDRVRLVLGFPNGTTAEVVVAPGDPGKTAAAVKKSDGSAIAGAKAVEAERAGGWTMEAKIPWAAFPAAQTTRVGLRAGVFVDDSDAASIDATVSNATGAGHGSLPLWPLEAEQALTAGLLKEKNLLAKRPTHDLYVNVHGDSMQERVLVYDRWLVVLGPRFRKGTEYFYADLGVEASMFVSVEARDLTGDGRDDLVLRKRIGKTGTYREQLGIDAFLSGDSPQSVFRHEVAVVTEKGSVENKVTFVQDGGKPAIKLEVAPAKGFDAGSYKEPTETSISAVLLPWGTVKSRTFRFDGRAVAQVSEEKQAPAAPRAPDPGPKPPVGSPAQPAAPGLEQVYALFKKERAVSGVARYDLTGDVEGSSDVERVVLHERELGVFGKGYRKGLGYASLQLSQFAAGADIREVRLEDLTGDGKSEVVVRGVVKAKASTSAGDGTVERELVFVYQVSADALKRVFAAEVGRSLGTSKLTGTFAKGAAKELVLSSGSATGWTEKTYPFGADAGGGIEPLLLPWPSAKKARYLWNGSAFAKQ